MQGLDANFVAERLREVVADEPKAFAYDIGVSLSAIYNYMNGRIPTTDVLFKIAPVTRVEAEEMLAGLKAARLLDGLRGQKAVDKPAVVDLIQRVSQLVTDLPMIQEMDLNPVLAFENGVFAVDGRIRI